MPSHSIRVTPHKPKREHGNEGKTQLHKEVEKLKRQVSRLKKELNKRGGLAEEAIEAAMQEEATVVEVTSVAEGPKCPECGGELKDIDLGGRVFVICGDCKYRRKAT